MVIVVTGRHHVAIHPFYQALQLDTPAICCNGTYLYDYQARKVITSDPMDKIQAKKVVDLLEFHGIHGLLYVDDAMLYQQAERPRQPFDRLGRHAAGRPASEHRSGQQPA